MRINDLPPTQVSAAAAVLYAIAELENELSKPRYYVVGRSKRSYLMLVHNMPYVIRETKIPNTQILLNRCELPLGQLGHLPAEIVGYENYPNLHVHLTTEEIARVVCPPHLDALYDKDRAPWHGRDYATAYLDRLYQLRALLT